MGTPTMGTTALLLTDVVGSTKLWQQHPAQMNVAMGRHHEIVAGIVAAHEGRLPVDQGEGDARFAAFGSSIAAVAAAVDIQRALAAEPWPSPITLTVRIGIHTGEVIERDGNLFGDPVNRCARIRGLAHGGQILLSGTTKALIDGWPPDGVGVLDLGEHRMKDLTEPVRIFQVTHADLPTEFPALQSLNRAKHNLPIQLSSFVGRRQNITDLVTLVEAHQLVTITGFGGMGKTRLALQVGAELADGNGDGVWFIDLSAIRDASLVPEAFTRVLGIPAAADALEALTAHLAAKQILLIVDNLEQLLPEAAAIIGALAAAGPGVHLLATSREAVGIRGEHAYPLPPLLSPGVSSSTETAESLGVYDAVRLFIERAAAADPAFTVTNSTAPAVAAICHTLDGWPLALELAAARIRLLGLPGLLARLSDRLGVLTGGARDLPDRQRTLRETIAWSYDLLTPTEQTLLNRLSVFAGGATLDAVEAVCADGVEDDVVDTVSSLLDKSLVRSTPRPNGHRLHLLETVREYALEQLQASGERNRLQRAHAHYLLELFPDLYSGPGASEFLDEVPNIVAALEASLVTDHAVAGRLFLSTSDKLLQLGHAATALSFCHRLQELDDLDPATAACVSIDEAIFAYFCADDPTARAAAQEPLRVLLDLRANQGYALRGCRLMVSIHAVNGEPAAAMTWVQRSIEVTGWSDPPARVHEPLLDGAYASRLAGDMDQAVAFARRAMNALPPDEDPSQHAWAHAELARCLVAAGTTDEALEVGADAVEIATPIRGVLLSYALGSYGRAQCVAGNLREAARLLVPSLLLARDCGVLPFDPGWAAVALSDSSPDVGAAMLGIADALFEKNGDPDLTPPSALLAPTRKLYEAAFAAEMARGREMGWPAVASLLDELDLNQATVP